MTNGARPGLGRQSERGSFQSLAAVVVVTLFAVGVLVLDLAGRAATRSAREAVVQGAALAAAQELGRVLETRTEGNAGLALSPGDRSAVLAAAIRVAASSTPALRLDPSNIRFVRRGEGGPAVIDSFVAPDAVQIRLESESSEGGRLEAVLASRIDGAVVGEEVSAMAGVSPLSSVPEGAVALPLGISDAWFEGRAPSCGSERRLHLRPGDPSACLSWHTFDAEGQGPSQILSRLAEDRFLAPSAVAEETKWRYLASAEVESFERLRRLYESRKDPSGHWRVLLPVHESLACGDARGWTKVVGFASATIYRVSGDPSPGLEAEVSCHSLHLGQGGGRDFGTGSVVLLER